MNANIYYYLCIDKRKSLFLCQFRSSLCSTMCNIAVWCRCVYILLSIPGKYLSSWKKYRIYERKKIKFIKELSQESTVTDFSCFNIYILRSCIKKYLCFERYKQFIVCKYFYAELLDVAFPSVLLYWEPLSVPLYLSQNRFFLWYAFSIVFPSIYWKANISLTFTYQVSIFHNISPYHNFLGKRKSCNFVCYFYQQSFDVSNLPLVIERKVNFSSHLLEIF